MLVFALAAVTGGTGVVASGAVRGAAVLEVGDVMSGIGTTSVTRPVCAQPEMKHRNAHAEVNADADADAYADADAEADASAAIGLEIECFRVSL
jgi:hypothetical protein